MKSDAPGGSEVHSMERSNTSVDCSNNATSLPYAIRNLSLFNPTENGTLPPQFRFTEQSLSVVVVYCLLFVVAAVGNLTVFISLFRGRHRKSRISLMMSHLAAADLLVTFIMIPLEVGWRLTVQWLAGNLACKMFLFLRAFGLYLSSNVLICVSLDRYFAILHPLKVNDARRRGKIMLAIAWVCSLLYAVPQSVVFHVSTHPKYPEFQQCVTFGFFMTQAQETGYNLFCVIAMYFGPLLVICCTYTKILCEICNKSREGKQLEIGRFTLRRSDISSIERARSRTLRMTITIVSVFILCWTPYVAMTLWYMFDRESAMRVDASVQDGLFIMAVGNSCANPLVYGSYVVNFRRECTRCFYPRQSASPPHQENAGVRLACRSTGK
ncbi:adipokinetic hormone/corazonin-related peptide receptor variant I-like [Athalia rosae]|uniref:adipokinetic hormone/corazonin-related peptide receptor variant I-like n=1 Tax=Athalia rosae TaxID=37344 RepID=UPI00203465AA|nr:adipokinetic hormone/corazonin-related peptide receptor variant I-like [Athalia rosae]